MDKEKPQKKPPKKITARYLYNAGLYYLKRYTASCAHFKTVMGRKIKTSCAYHSDQDMQVCLKILDEVTARLVEEGFLNDTAFARGMVTSLRRKGLSRQAIQRRLQIKGLARDLVNDTLLCVDRDLCFDLPDYDARQAEQKAAFTHARRKKIGPYARLRTDDEKAYQRGLASLARAGFSYDIARSVMDYDDEGSLP